MRYYTIKLLNSSGQIVAFSPSSGTFGTTTQGYTWTSHPNGVFNTAALNIELDVVAYPFGAFQGLSHLRVWGVGLPELAQASNLTGYTVEIDAGMVAPYNLNITAAAGQILAGQVFQGYGNWEGVNQCLDLIIANGTILPEAASDISFSWKANTPLSDAITQSLSAAFPAYNLNMAIQRTVLGHDEAGHYNTLKAFSESLLEMTQTASYSGVQIRAAGDTIYVYDSSVAQPIISIQFADIIGQPTWISTASVSFACVLRGDIQVGNQIQFPTGLFTPYVLTTQRAALPNAPSTNKMAFQGTFTVTEVHHYGNFRDANADSWRTVYVVVPNDNLGEISNYPTTPAQFA